MSSILNKKVKLYNYFFGFYRLRAQDENWSLPVVAMFSSVFQVAQWLYGV